MTAENSLFDRADFDAATIPLVIRKTRRVRAEIVRQMLALNTNKLVARGYRGRDIEAFRDDRTVFLRARS